ncbi:MAG: TSUP family transporter [Oscillospiraceae bacterium]|nr:TSUP family transporter [Oscillospiraceae bacterium]
MSGGVALSLVAAFLSGMIGAMGMGGGSVLIIYLTAYLGFEQLKAQGVNLVFFLPIAAVALFFHQKNRLIRWRVALPLAALGLAGVWAGMQLAVCVGSQLLGKLFGGLLLIIGLRELLAKRKAED